MRTLLASLMAPARSPDTSLVDGNRDWLAVLLSLETLLGVAVLLILWGVVVLAAGASRQKQRPAGRPRRRLEVVVLDLDGFTDEQLARLVSLRRQHRQRHRASSRGELPGQDARTLNRAFSPADGERGWYRSVGKRPAVVPVRTRKQLKPGLTWTVGASGLAVLPFALEIVWSGVGMSWLALVATVPVTVHWGWRAGVLAAGLGAGVLLVVVTEPRWSVAVADPWAYLRIGLALGGMLLVILLLHRRGGAGRPLHREHGSRTA